MVSKRLRTLAHEYLEVRDAQEQDHTDSVLNWQRTEAHDALMLQMDCEGIPYADREDAARIARGIVEGTYHRPMAPGEELPSKVEKAEQMSLPM